MKSINTLRNKYRYSIRRGREHYPSRDYIRFCRKKILYGFTSYIAWSIRYHKWLRKNILQLHNYNEEYKYH